MDLQLSGSRVLVTGGTKGIGRAVVEALLAEGAHVAFCARNADEVAAAQQELSAAGTVHGSVVDVRDAAGLAGWVAASAETLGGIDVVVANVSALNIDDTEDAWAACFEIDVMHTVRLVWAAMPHLERSGHGAIIAVSSVSGREIDFAAGSYGAMKAALVHYVQGLAYRLAPKNIRANTVSPGNTFIEGGIWDMIKNNVPDLYASSLALNPTGRMGTAQEMAAAVVFLASPVSSFTSGANLVVDGALTRGVQF